MTAAILDEIARTSQWLRAIPVFVYIPAIDDPMDPNAVPDGEKFLFAFCDARKSMRCLSARPLFVEKIKKGVKLETGATGHWGPLANLTIAEAIYKFLGPSDIESLPLHPPKGHEKKTM